MALAGLFGPTMLLFSAATQGLSGELSYKNDVQNEIDRQKQICGEIAATNERQQQIDSLLSKIHKISDIDTQTDQAISDLNDGIIASNKKIINTKQYYRKRLALVILTNISIVAMIVLYIYFKTLQ